MLCYIVTTLLVFSFSLFLSRFRKCMYMYIQAYMYFVLMHFFLFINLFILPLWNFTICLPYDTLFPVIFHINSNQNVIYLMASETGSAI